MNGHQWFEPVARTVDRTVDRTVGRTVGRAVNGAVERQVVGRMPSKGSPPRPGPGIAQLPVCPDTPPGPPAPTAGSHWRQRVPSDGVLAT